MAELNLQLKGWPTVIAAALIVVIILAARVMSLSDMTGDEELMKHVDTLLMSEHYPDIADRMKNAVETGDSEAISKAAKSVTSSKVTVHAVQASYPVLDFSRPKTVVVKVTYSLDDDSGPGEERIEYYQFQRGVIGWTYEYKTTSLSYYLNFT